MGLFGPGGRDPASGNAGDEEHIGDRGAAARHRRDSRLRWLTAAILITTLVGAAGHAGWHRLQQHQNEVAAAQALDAARKYAITLTSIDSTGIDQTIADILDGSMGEFNDRYTKSGSQLRQILVDNEASARGHVVEAVVKSASTNKVDVVLFIDQSVTNNGLTQPRIERSRIRMTMEKVEGRWLVSRIELP